MNKMILKANDYWHSNDIPQAMCNYKKALQSAQLLTHEKNIAVYMLAYLNCLLARKLCQEDAFLGVDLRSAYQDYYLEAARYLQQFDAEHYSPDVLGLPAIDVSVRHKISEAWHYYQQLQFAYVASWQLRLKHYIQHSMSGFLRKMHRQMHV